MFNKNVLKIFEIILQKIIEFQFKNKRTQNF